MNADQENRDIGTSGHRVIWTRDAGDMRHAADRLTD
jgi:hypothetical protein